MKLWTLSLPLALVAFVSTAAAEPVTLALKFPAGQVDRLSIDMQMDQTVSADVLPAPQKQKLDIGFDATLKVVSSDAAGAVVEMTYERMKLAMTMPGQDITFDSAKDKADPTNPVASALAAIVGGKLTLHFKPDGKIEKIDGSDEVAKKAQGANPAVASIVSQMVSEAHLKQLLDVSFAEGLPAKPVNVGDTWESTLTQNSGGMGITMKIDSKLVGVEEKAGHQVAKIDCDGKGTLAAGGPAGGKLKVDQLVQKGSREFDLTRGWFTHGETSQTMQASMTIAGPDGKTLSMKIDQELKATTNVSPAK